METKRGITPNPWTATTRTLSRMVAGGGNRVFLEQIPDKNVRAASARKRCPMGLGCQRFFFVFYESASQARFFRSAWLEK